MLKTNAMKFYKEEFGEEQMMMLNATEEFSKIEIKPNIMRFEEKDYALVESLMRKINWVYSMYSKMAGVLNGFNTGMLICEEISSLTGSVAMLVSHWDWNTSYFIVRNRRAKEYYLPKYPLENGFLATILQSQMQVQMQP